LVSPTKQKAKRHFVDARIGFFLNGWTDMCIMLVTKLWGFHLPDRLPVARKTGIIAKIKKLDVIGKYFVT
jgi:hypothetical protein